jgi:WD40 repeat protein
VVGGVGMRNLLICAALSMIILAGAVRLGIAQTLPSEARGSATSQIAMLSVSDHDCASGIIVGYDNKSIYIATAAHILADPSVALTAKVMVRFIGVDRPRQGTFFPTQSPVAEDDLAVVLVDRDRAVDAYLDGLNFAMLPFGKNLFANRPVTSIGCWGGTRWAAGVDESLLSTDKTLRVRSEVNEGQSGGGLFSDAWELIGMPLVAGVNEISARPISAVLNDLRSWGVPVLLRARSPKDRVMGAEELAQRVLRRDLSARLASQAAETRADAPVRALLLGVEAVNQSRPNGYATPAAREALAKGMEGVSGVGISGHADTIEQSVFSSDERFLATASEDGLIRIWNLTTPNSLKPVKVLQGPTRAEPGFLTFDRQSRRLIAIVYERESRGGAVAVWPLDGPDPAPIPVKTPIGANSAVTAAASSPEHDLLAVASEGQVLLYNLGGNGSPRSTRALTVPSGLKATHLAFSRDAKVLLAGTTGARVLIWNLTSSGNGPTSTLATGHKQLGPFGDIPDLDLIDINDDHTLLMTGSTKWSLESSFADPTIKVWQLKDLTPTGKVTILDQSADERNKALQGAFLTEGSRKLVAATLSGKINIWNLGGVGTGVEAPLAVVKLNGFISGAARSSDRRVFALAHGEVVELMRSEDLATGSPPMATLRGFDSSVRHVEISRSGRFLFGAAIGGSGRLWDLQQVDPIAPLGTLIPTPYVEVKPVGMSATGRIVAVMRKGMLEVWSISDPVKPKHLETVRLSQIEWENCVPCHIVISDSDRWISVQSPADKDKSQVIEIAPDKGKSRRQFLINSRTWTPTHEITFTPDSKWLLVDETENILVAYDLALAQPKRVVLSEGRPFYNPLFSPDGKWLVLRGMRFADKHYEEDGFLVPLDALSNRAKWIPLKGFSRGLGSVEFSPDSRWIALAGESEFQARERDDRSVQLMRLETGQWKMYANFKPIEYAASGLAFSPDGRWLFTGGTDITLGDRNVSARVWDLNSPVNESAGQTLPNVIWNIKRVEFSPDSKWMITASGAEEYAKLWGFKNGRIEFVSKLIGPVPKLNNRWYATFSRDSRKVVVWTIDDAIPFFWDLDADVIPENGVAIPNGDRAIEELKFSNDGRNLIILNSGGTNTGTSGSAGAHITVVDLDHFPAEEAYTLLPAAAGATGYKYREDLGLILTTGDAAVMVTLADLDRQLERARVIAGRNLTWEEWKKSPLGEVYRPTFSDRTVTPDVIEAVLPKIGALSASGRKAEAAQLQQEVIRWTRELRDGNVCNSVAWELAQLRVTDTALDTALEFSQCALRASPTDPNFRDTYGVVLAMLGRHEEAIREFLYFLENVQGIDRFQNAVPLRRKWVERLRARQAPFVELSN